MSIEFRRFTHVDSLVDKVGTTFVYIAASVGVVNGMLANNYKYAFIGAGLAAAALAATYWYNSAHDDDDYGDS